MREAWCNVDEETMQQCRIDAQVLLRKEECPSRMLLRRGECALGMEQSTSDAALKDAHMKHRAKVERCSSEGCTHEASGKG